MTRKKQMEDIFRVWEKWNDMELSGEEAIAQIKEIVEKS